MKFQKNLFLLTVVSVVASATLVQAVGNNQIANSNPMLGAVKQTKATMPNGGDLAIAQAKAPVNKDLKSQHADMLNLCEQNCAQTQAAVAQGQQLDKNATGTANFLQGQGKNLPGTLKGQTVKLKQSQQKASKVHNDTLNSINHLHKQISKKLATLKTHTRKTSPDLKAQQMDTQNALNSAALGNAKDSKATKGSKSKGSKSKESKESKASGSNNINN